MLIEHCEAPNSVDTRLSNSRHRFELGRGVVAEGRVTTHPIVEHCDVLEDLLPRFFTCEVTPMMNQFLLERAEEALHTGIVPAVALAAHRTFDAVVTQDLPVDRSRKNLFNPVISRGA